MSEELRIYLGDFVSGNMQPEMVFHRTGWCRTLIMGESGGGKTVLAMNLVVPTSKYRKIVMFSLRGEWEGKVTKLNYKSPTPLKIDDVLVVKDFCVKLSDFTGAGDFSSLGFSRDACEILDICIVQGRKVHNDSVAVFKEMLREYPTKRDEVAAFNDKYGLDIMDAAHPETARSLRNNFKYIEEWLWTPESKLQYVDFVKAFLDNQHLIINIGEDTNKARCLCGIILRKIRYAGYQKKPVFVFEEMWKLLPMINDASGDTYLPNSVVEIQDLLTTGRKEGVGFIGITQHENQIYRLALEHIFTKIYVGTYNHAKNFEGDLARRLKWNPHANNGAGFREALIYNKNNSYCKFIPAYPCCQV